MKHNPEDCPNLDYNKHGLWPCIDCKEEKKMEKNKKTDLRIADEITTEFVFTDKFNSGLATNYKEIYNFLFRHCTDQAAQKAAKEFIDGSGPRMGYFK